MIYILIMVLTQPITLALHAKLYAELVYPVRFHSIEACQNQARIENSAPDVMVSYCKPLDIK